MKLSKSFIFRLSAFLAALFIIFTLIRKAGFESFWHTISRTLPYWIAAAIAVYASSWLLRTFRLRLFTDHAGKPIGMAGLFKLHISGFALNAIMPAKIGDAAMIGYLKARGIGITRSAAIVIQTRILDILALILLVVPTIIIFSKEKAPSWLTTSIILSLIAVSIPFGFVYADRRRKFSHLLYRLRNKVKQKKLKYAFEKLNNAYISYYDIVKNKRLLLNSMLVSLGIWFMEGLTCYVIAIAVGANIPLAVAVIAVSLGNFAKSAQVTPGGLGVYEGALAAFLALNGVPFDVAVAIAILDHSIKKLFNLAIGLPLTANLGAVFVIARPRSGRSNLLSPSSLRAKRSNLLTQELDL